MASFSIRQKQRAPWYLDFNCVLPGWPFACGKAENAEAEKADAGGQPKPKVKGEKKGKVKALIARELSLRRLSLRRLITHTKQVLSGSSLSRYSAGRLRVPSQRACSQA